MFSGAFNRFPELRIVPRLHASVLCDAAGLPALRRNGPPCRGRHAHAGQELRRLIKLVMKLVPWLSTLEDRPNSILIGDCTY